MPGKRAWNSKGLYHVIVGGNQRQKNFTMTETNSSTWRKSNITGNAGRSAGSDITANK